MDLSKLNTRNARIAAGAAAAAVVALVIVIVVVASGGDDEQASPPTSSSDVATSETESSGSASTTSTDASTSPTSTAATSVVETSSPPDTTVQGSTTATDPAPTVAATTTLATAPATSVVEVPTGSLETLAPVPSNEVGDFGTGLLVSIVALDAVDGTATVPGEIAGPAIRVTIEAVNDSDAPIDLQRAQLEVTYGTDRSPGNALSSGTEPLTGVLAPGATARGVYVYGVPADQRDLINILVSYDVDAPIVVFEGPGPSA